MTIEKPAAYDVIAGLTCGLEFTEEHQIDHLCDCFGYTTEYNTVTHILMKHLTRAIK